jgi:hypothetical protein
MADLINPSASFTNGFNAAQNVTDTFRKNMAFKALEKSYGPIVGDMKLATDVQAYEQNELLNPLEVQAKQLTNTGLERANAFNAANDPLVLKGNQLSNDTSQFNLDQSRSEADRAETIRQAQQAHTMLGGVLDSVETSLNGVVDPNQRLEVFDTQVRQLAPLIGAEPEALLHQLAQQRAAIATQGSAAIGPMRQQLDDLLYSGLSAEEKQKLVTGALEQDYKRAQIEKSAADTAKVQAETAAKAEEKAKAAKGAARALDDFEAKQEVVNTAIDEAIRIASRYPTATGPQTTLPGGNLLPGAADLAAQLETITGNIGFDALQTMRENSPTGGALGNVSDNEGKRLNATLGAVSQEQTRAQFIAGLRRVKAQRAAAAKRARQAYDDDFADAGKTDTSDDAEVIDFTDYFGAE